MIFIQPIRKNDIVPEAGKQIELGKQFMNAHNWTDGEYNITLRYISLSEKDAIFNKKIINTTLKVRGSERGGDRVGVDCKEYSFSRNIGLPPLKKFFVEDLNLKEAKGFFVLEDNGDNGAAFNLYYIPDGTSFEMFYNKFKNVVDLAIDKESSLLEHYEDFPLQQIFYGAPGTGKSNKIKECTEGDDTVIRTTFHPDTDYSTFVGCYKPTKETIGILSLHKLHELYPDFKNAVSNRPLHRFITKYYNSFRLLTEKEAESVFDKIETPSTVSAEVPKILAAIEELPASQTITYSFIEQAFTKAYVLAWKKMCDISLPATTPSAVIPASTSTLPYSLTGKIGSSLDFDYTPDGATLTDPEKDLLNKVDNFDFPFDGIDNFAELHNKIKVVVKDQPNDNQKDRYRKKITLKADDVRKLYALWESDHDKYVFLIQGLLRNIYEKLREEGKLKKEDEIYKLKDYNGDDVTIEVNDSFKLLGMYDFSSKTVYLFKNNIGDNTDLLCAVYIHEMFHAYFDSLNQYVPEIEEPIVECCTLCFLELFDDKICESYLMDVESKIRSSAICYYGFGAYLYENRSLDWMMLYKNGFNKIKASSDIVNNYNNKFLPIYPFDYEQETMSLLYNILNPQSKTEYDKSAQFLIIEEINRGNCAQIFGDLFQLLDRKAGYSEYPIEPDEDLRKELEKEFTGLKLDIGIQNHINSLFKENYPNGITDKILKGKLLVLPENLYIWATMNTSDQSLFPIDSAFKRRWDWKYVPIFDGKKGWKIEVNGIYYDWWDFLQKINDKIGSTTNSEDKKLGYYFCKATNDIINAETFVSKVVFYIWNDVFKDFSEEADGLFKDDNGALSFNKFYTVNGEGKTMVVKEKIIRLLQNLGVKPIGQIEEKEIVNGESEEISDSIGGNGHKSIRSVVFPDGKVISTDNMTHFEVYLESLKKIGIETVYPVIAKMKYQRKGCPLISTEKLPGIINSNEYSYYQEGQYFIVKGASDDTLINILNDLNSKLDLGIIVNYE